MLSRVMVVAPHSDDEVLGCGGLLGRLENRARIALVLCACSSGVGRCPAMHETRRTEFSQVAKALEADWFCLDLPDTRLREGMPELVGHLDRLLETWGPDTLLFPSRSFHQDHVAAHDAVFAAMRPGKGRTVKMLACYESPENVWAEDDLLFRPNWRVILTEADLKRKAQLCSLHVSQMGGNVSAFRGERSVTTLAERRGSEIGERYAEAYRVISWRF